MMEIKLSQLKDELAGQQKVLNVITDLRIFDRNIKKMKQPSAVIGQSRTRLEFWTKSSEKNRRKRKDTSGKRKLFLRLSYS